MDPLGTNKIMAAVLGAALVFMAIRTLPEFIMHHDTPDVPAYWVGEVITEDAGPELDLPFPQLSWVSAMDAERGAKVFKKCTSCHNAEAGGGNGTGPALYDVVGRKSGEVAGFGYSEAMANAGYAWGYEELDGFLEKPKTYMPGTKMNFVGLKKAEDRAAVIEYLRIASANPKDRPQPAAAPVSQEVENLTVEPEGGISTGNRVLEEVEGEITPEQPEATDNIPEGGAGQDGDEAEAMTPEQREDVD